MFVDPTPPSPSPWKLSPPSAARNPPTIQHLPALPNPLATLRFGEEQDYNAVTPPSSAVIGLAAAADGLAAGSSTCGAQVRGAEDTSQPRRHRRDMRRATGPGECCCCCCGGGARTVR
jgi:hypothetical protein